MNNLTQRTITGIAFLLVLVSSILFGKFAFSSIMLIVITIGMTEYYEQVVKIQAIPLRTTGIILGISLIIVNLLFSIQLIPIKTYLLFFPAVLFIFIVELFRKNSNPFKNIAFTILGIIYVAIPLSLLSFFYLDFFKYDFTLLLFFFGFIWINDTFAYVTGILFGRHKIWIRISPKKSWEGMFGGLFFSVGFAVLISFYFTEIALHHWIIISLLTSLGAVFGDFTESLLKRSTQSKDSGKILPGHGGILDRFDSVLVASPLVFTYLYLFII